MFPIRDHNPSHKLPLLTLLIIGLNIFVFFLELTTPNLDSFISQYALTPSRINFLDFTSLFPFISSMFLHGGWLHIISNMWFLWIFGDNVEATLSQIGFVVFYLFAGICGSLLQYIINPSSSIPMLGASGAIAGVLGFYMTVFPHAKVETLVASFGGFWQTVNLPANFMLFYWFAMQLLGGVGSFVTLDSQGGGVAFFAHIGGFAAGFIVGKIVSSQISWRRVE